MCGWHPWICRGKNALKTQQFLGIEKHIENTFFWFFLGLGSFAVFQGCLVDSMLNSLCLIFCLVLNIYTWFLIVGTFGEIDRLFYIHSTTLHDTSTRHDHRYLVVE